MLQFETHALPVAGQPSATTTQAPESDLDEGGEKTFAELVNESDPGNVAPDENAIEGEEGAAEEPVEVIDDEEFDVDVELEEIAPDTSNAVPVEAATKRLPEIGQNSSGPVSRDHVISKPISADETLVEKSLKGDQTGQDQRERIDPISTALAGSLQRGAFNQPSATTAAQMALGNALPSSTKVREERSVDGVTNRSAAAQKTKSVAPAAPVSLPLQPNGLVTSVYGPERLFQFVESLSTLGQDAELVGSQQTSSQSVQATVAAIPLRFNAQPVVAQIAAAVLQSNGATTEIRLSPEELGKVRISMTSGEAGLVVNIFAERPETTDLMRRHIDSLAREFQNLGYEELSFSFDQGDSEPENDHPEMGGQSGAMLAAGVEEAVQVAVPLGILDLKL